MTGRVAPQPPYTDAAQRRQADFLGMYLFLASEVMLFGGLFTALFAYRILHPEAAAAAAGHLKIWLGTANTAVLLTSSFCVAVGVSAGRAGLRGPAAGLLLVAAALGLLFLSIKGVEYHAEYAEGLMPSLGGPSPLAGQPAALVMNLYFVATGLHAVHLTIGVAALCIVAARLLMGGLNVPGRVIVLEMTGLYWHLVDVVWIFLYPLLYLAR